MPKLLPDRSSITTAEIGQILIATQSEKYVNGRMGPVIALDRQSTPGLNMFRSKLSKGRAMPVQGGYKLIVKGERGKKLQAYSGRDLLNFQSSETMFELIYGTGAVHLGDEWVLQQLKEAGVSIEWNTSNGKAPGQVASSTFEVVANLAKEKLEDFENNYIQELNKAVWLANALDPKMFTGIDGHLPVTSNSAGTIGRKSRSNPLLRHHLRTGVAVANLEQEIQQVVRAANKRNAGVNSRINMAICGEAFYDAITEHLFTGANARYDRNIAVDQAAKWSQRLGIGIPPDALMIPNVGVLMVEPIFEQLDIDNAPQSPWQKRLYLLNSSHITFKPTPNDDGKLTTHPSPYNQKVLRMSMTGEYAFCIDKPNSHAVMTLA